MLGVVVTVLLTAAGPAQADWASRAGTPHGLGGTAVTGASWREQVTRALGGGLAVGGVLDERLEPDASTDRAREAFSTNLPGGSLVMVLEGPAYETGLVLASSAVTLGPTGSPALFRGSVVASTGSSYTLSVSGPGVTGWRLRLAATPTSPTAWTGRLAR